VVAGSITGDIKGKTTDPEAEQVLDLYEFLDAVAGRMG